MHKKKKGKNILYENEFDFQESERAGETHFHKNDLASFDAQATDDSEIVYLDFIGLIFFMARKMSSCFFLIQEKNENFACFENWYHGCSLYEVYRYNR